MAFLNFTISMVLFEPLAISEGFADFAGSNGSDSFDAFHFFVGLSSCPSRF